MFAIRQAKIEDVPTLVKLAKLVHFINLPADREIIYTKVTRSRECFFQAAGGAVEGLEGGAGDPGMDGQGQGLGAAAKHGHSFMFVVEDTETGACLGTSQIIAHMGGPGNPNFSLKLEKRSFFSTSLQTGTSHVVARLHADETGPTEIGGLILQPASRGHKTGRLLSLIRFHMIGLHRELFADRVIAEMMGPITMDGQSMLWEFLGRRFIPLSYTEADKHCQRSREFISALMPKEDIYLSLLPPEARDVIGRVGEETVPARRMLEKLGFEYRDEVDPFDGGPVLAAKTDSISVVKNTSRGVLVEGGGGTHFGFVSVLTPEGEFRAVQTELAMEARGKVAISGAVMEELGWEAGMEVGVTPLEAIKGGKKGAKAKGGKVRA